MKDLFVMTADADAMAVMNSVLKRPESLGIRPITFEVIRHTMRDSGVIKDGPEISRMYKGKFAKTLMMWDYHGSGLEARLSPTDSIARMQGRLDSVTWEGNSGAVVLVPELEEWLWRNTASLCSYLGVEQDKINSWLSEFPHPGKRRLPPAALIESYPKELFEYICIGKIKRTISPRDFEEIARVASLRAWQESESFARVVGLLRGWFGVEMAKNG